MCPRWRCEITGLFQPSGLTVVSWDQQLVTSVMCRLVADTVETPQPRGGELLLLMGFPGQTAEGVLLALCRRQK